MQSSERRTRFVVGIFIILLGVLSLLNNAVTENVAAWLWILGLGLSAVMFGWAFTFERDTWAAIGSYVTGAIALLIFLITQVQLAGVLVPVLVLLGIGLPFIVAWWVDRKQWGLLVPAYVMIAIIPVLFLEEATYETPEIIPAYTLLAIALPFLVAYIVTRKLEALVPGGILFLLSLAFFGVSLGLSTQILSTLIPVVVIVIGIVLLYRGWTSDVHKQP